MKANLCGGSHELKLPIGGLDEIARVEPKIYRLAQRLVSGDWELRELRAILAAGLKWGKSTLEADEVIEKEGLTRATETALALMLEVMDPLAAIAEDDDAGKLKESLKDSAPDPS